MQAIRDQIVALSLEGLPEEEVQVRDNYFNEESGEIFQGTSIHEGGETYHDGVIGMHDVGYMVLVTTVTTKRGDARKTNDMPQIIREHIRRYFQNQRLGIPGADGIKHHNVKVQDSDPRDANKFPNHKIQQQRLVVWNREPRTLPTGV